MKRLEEPFSIEIDVGVDETQVRDLLTLAGMPNAPIPSSYVLCWLGQASVRAWLMDHTPPDHLPVFARQMICTFEPLESRQRYRLLATMTKLDRKATTARIDFGVARSRYQVLQGEIEVLFLPRTEILGA